MIMKLKHLYQELSVSKLASVVWNTDRANMAQPMSDYNGVTGPRGTI